MFIVCFSKLSSLDLCKSSSPLPGLNLIFNCYVFTGSIMRFDKPNPCDYTHFLTYELKQLKGVSFCTFLPSVGWLI